MTATVKRINDRPATPALSLASAKRDDLHKTACFPGILQTFYAGIAWPFWPADVARLLPLDAAMAVEPAPHVAALYSRIAILEAHNAS